MTPADEMTGPGLATAPALVVSKSAESKRDFDGGLLNRTSFTLTRDDALAFLYLPRPLSGRVKLARSLWYVAGGVLAGILPETITGPAYSLQFIAVLLTILALQFVLLHAARALWRLRIAQKLIPTPRPAVFEEWTDCIAGPDLNDPDPNEIYLSPELIGQVVDTPTHIFILSGQTSITLPKRAVEDPAAMVLYLRQLAKGPYYFDP